MNSEAVVVDESVCKMTDIEFKQVGIRWILHQIARF